MIDRGETINRSQFSLILIVSLSLVLGFNNCGQLSPKPSDARPTSSEQEYPWPNRTTTLLQSDKIVSAAAFGDMDNDTYEDAVFISESDENGGRILRWVRSGSFREMANFSDLSPFPSADIKMFFVDVDMDGSEKELLYVSETQDRLVAVRLLDEGSVQTVFNLPLIERLQAFDINAFFEKDIGPTKSIDIGKSSLVLTPGQDPRIEDNTLPINGAWSEYSDWSACSRTCGDGKQVRMRTCTQPLPRNGGQFCGGESIEFQSCRLTDCQPTDCGQYEKFEDGSCVPDPDNPPPAGSSGGSSGGLNGSVGGSRPGSGGGVVGGVIGGNFDPTNPRDCPAGKIYDPFWFRCFKPYVINNVRLTWIERVWGRGRDDNYGYENINHTYRLSLSHPRARGLPPLETAREYCRFRGHNDVISYKTGTFNVGRENRKVFILCNIGTNGLYYRYGGCQVGNLQAAFTVKPGNNYIEHAANEEITYLKSVTCRKNE